MSVFPNKVIYDKDFQKEVSRFPGDIQLKLASLIELLQKDVFDSRLHTKPLGPPLQSIFSFRITRDYRVCFEFISPGVIRLLVAGTRGNIYKRIERKL